MDMDIHFWNSIAYYTFLNFSSIVLFLVCTIRKCKMMFWCYFNIEVDKLHQTKFTWNVGVNLHRLWCITGTAVQSQKSVNAKPLSIICCATLSQCIQCATVRVFSRQLLVQCLSIYSFIFKCLKQGRAPITNVHCNRNEMNSFHFIQFIF